MTPKIPTNTKQIHIVKIKRFIPDSFNPTGIKKNPIEQIAVSGGMIFLRPLVSISFPIPIIDTSNVGAPKANTIITFSFRSYS